MAYPKLQACRVSGVTPSDTDEIPNVATEDGLGNNGCVLYIGTGGDVSVKTVGNDLVIFKNVPSGTFFPVQVLQVLDSGTDAEDILALW